MTTQTITYNKDNWSGEKATVTIKPRSFKVHGTDFTGTYSIKHYKECGAVATVTIKDAGDIIDTQTVYDLDNGWYGEFNDSSRMAVHPVITALQIIHNTY